MGSLSRDAFVKALQSENIILIVGKQQEHLAIAKDLLCLQSPHCDKLVAECDGTIELPLESVVAVKIFVRWCYQEHLQPIQPDATMQEKKHHKNSLMRLWIFAGSYGIGKLQNQSMCALLSLFNTPYLLSKNDVQFIWTRAEGTTTELRSLTAFVLVAQIEEDNGEYVTEIEDINEFANLQGFLSEIYSALRRWLLFQPPKSPKKDKKTKWDFFVKTAEICSILMVDETSPSVAPPRQTQVANSSIKKETDIPSIKKEGNEKGAKRAPEVIVLD